MTIYLALNGNYSPVPGLLESEKAWRLSQLFNPESLEAVAAADLRLLICEDGHTGFSWKEYSAIARRKNPKVFFILLSSYLGLAEAYAGGADLIVSPSDNQGLITLLHAFFKRTEQVQPLQPDGSDSMKAMLDAMQEKNRELEKISFELDRFVYSASHDLRAPLTSVLGLLYLLRNETTEENTLHYIKLMEDSILKLDNTIRDIVAYSRNNRLEVAFEPVVLSEMVEEILTGLRYLETPELNLHAVIHVQPVEIFYTDRNRLQVVLNNLLSNAIRYRHPERELSISVSCILSGNEISFRVEDNGTGISDRHIDRIFDMFYRSNEGSTGSGLGLYIVRETIKKMGGSIQVNSDPEKGTVFTILIPNLPGGDKRISK
jgi:signal transduction histidine kinase